MTELSERGKHAQPLVDLEGRDPDEFALATAAQGLLRRFAEFAEATKPNVVVRGAFPRERLIMAEHADRIRHWLTELRREIKEAKP